MIGGDMDLLTPKGFNAAMEFSGETAESELERIPPDVAEYLRKVTCMLNRTVLRFEPPSVEATDGIIAVVLGIMADVIDPEGTGEPTISAAVLRESARHFRELPK
jgi:hypothetical protein